ncbi:single-stranded-DNA-specific exonuclease RecJ [Sporolactobacillus sp. THM7-4]|nr:single-stranded-DNA-specific exonuclease RecJ [Sporolactobacillus sp. THM7-4]
MLKPNSRWILNRADGEKVSRLSAELNISPLTARLLILRGIEDPEKADVFLHTDKAEFHDPLDMLGMREALVRIRHAVENHEPIRIFGDYDADGVTSTALIVRALKEMGANVDSYIPNRFKDGYGPNVPAVERAAKDGVRLIITVDSGIAALDPAEAARRLGVDYIVTDHHEPPAVLPDAMTILNPKQPGCDYPFKGLSGAGIALKLVQALCPDAGVGDWTALAAIGTIADLVPLQDENRLIALKGLRTINAGTYTGITALKAKAGCTGPADSDTIGFQIAPRLNAAGRMSDADSALRLLLSDDENESALLAEELEELNQSRKSLVDSIFNEADKQAGILYEQGYTALVIAGEKWHQGVIGIVASRIVEKYYRPTIILSIDKQAGLARGSGRSIEGFNIYQGLTASRVHLIQFGGHKMAAGLTLRADEITAFRDDFNQAAARELNEQDLVPLVEVDGQCTPDQITTEQIDQLALLEPFGTGNPRPMFQMSGVALSRLSCVGRKNDHLKLTFKGEKKELDGIGFGLGKKKEMISPIDRISVIGRWGINEWNGFRKPQFMIEDMAVDGLQLFDWRSEQQLDEKIDRLGPDQTAVVSFQPDSADQMQISIQTVRYRQGLVIDKPCLVLLDLPDREEQLSELLRNSPAVHRIYAVFYHPRDHYFSSFPTRNHFKWYYALILQKQSFKLSAMVKQVAGYKGWSSSSIYFMTQVFFDLDFVKIEEDILTVNQKPTKAPLTSSATYQRAKSQLEMEELFCYSSLTSLKAWFDKHAAAEPEGTIHGL